MRIKKKDSFQKNVSFNFIPIQKKHYHAIQAVRVIMAPLAQTITLVDIHVHVPQDTLVLIVNIVCRNKCNQI